jgi:hypothetical protein
MAASTFDTLYAAAYQHVASMFGRAATLKSPAGTETAVIVSGLVPEIEIEAEDESGLRRKLFSSRCTLSAASISPDVGWRLLVNGLSYNVVPPIRRLAGDVSELTLERPRPTRSAEPGHRSGKFA